MRRVGPWVLAGGLALLCAGIASTGLETWPADQGERVEAIELSGVDAVDIGDSRVDEIVIGGRDDAEMRFTKWRNSRDAGERAPVTLTKSDGVLRLDSQMGWQQSNNVSLWLPPRVSRLAGRRIKAESRVPMPVLRIDAARVEWVDGEVGELDVHMDAGRGRACGGSRASFPETQLEFVAGKVDRLRIWVERGGVTLRDLSNVGTVDVYAGPDVSLTVGKVGDLARIALHPYDRSAASGSKRAPDAPAPVEACAMALD
jgi:hypothetical protein